MVFYTAIVTIIMSSAIGICFAKRYPNQKKIWAGVDLLWLVVACIAFLYLVNKLDEPLNQANYESAINNLAYQRDTMKHEAYLLDGRYCNNNVHVHKPTASHFQYCENLRKVIFYSGVPHLTYFYVKDMVKKFEQLKTEYYPEDSAKFTLALASYVNNPYFKESQIQANPYDKPIKYYKWSQYYLIIFVVFFGLRVGKSCRGFFVIQDK